MTSLGNWETVLRRMETSPSIAHIIDSRMWLSHYPFRYELNNVFGSIVYHVLDHVGYYLRELDDNIRACDKLSNIITARLMVATCRRGAAYSTEPTISSVYAIAQDCLAHRVGQHLRG